MYAEKYFKPKEKFITLNKLELQTKNIQKLSNINNIMKIQIVSKNNSIKKM